MTDSVRTETISDDPPSRGSGDGEAYPPGSELGGRWEISRVLGRGGFSVVYLALDRELGREVALKVLRADRLGESNLRRLRREAAIARDLAHPNLVRIHDIEQVDSAVFLTMEAVRGESLRERLKRGPMPVADAVGVGIQMVRGLVALHAAGIVHRDIKPGNVLLASDGAVKLADFGLALDLAADETRLTRTEATVGTIEYLSPEQALGEEVDARSDLYSAGIVLYEMLAGKLPHTGRSSLGSLVARFRTRPSPLSRHRRGVPRWLTRLVSRLLEPHRHDRYGSADQVLADLERRRVRWALPRRGVWRGAAAAVATLAVGLAFWQYREIRAASFSHLVALNEGTAVVAYDQRGRELWRKTDVRASNNFVRLRLGAGRGLRIAASLAANKDYALERTRILSFLDPKTGAELERLELPEASLEFQGFAPTFGANLSAVDLDGDGADELVVDYLHNPFWPSYSVLVEPDQQRARIVFVGSGHHWFRGARDLDGDGQPELVYAGVNNRMGWHQGIAAVRSPVGPGRRSDREFVWGPGMSADRLARSMAGYNLLWYALAPRGLLSASPSALHFDAAQRLIRLDYARRAPYLIDFDGFDTRGDTAPSIPVAERRQILQRAYFSMVEGMRLEEALDSPAAAAAYADAVASARRAAEPVLVLWLRQLHNRARAGNEPWKSVRSEMLQLMSESESPSEIAFDTARALHRRGRLNEALESYRLSFESLGASDGRGQYELIEGEMLALVELGRLDEARRRTEASCRAASIEWIVCSIMAAVPSWLQGRPVDIPESNLSLVGIPELDRYWMLEFLLASGKPLSEMQGLVDRDIAATNVGAVLVESLAAEIAGRSGRIEEASRRANAARDRLELELPGDLTLRIQARLVRERAARWSAAAQRRPAPPPS